MLPAILFGIAVLFFIAWLVKDRRIHLLSIIAVVLACLATFVAIQATVWQQWIPVVLAIATIVCIFFIKDTEVVNEENIVDKTHNPTARRRFWVTLFTVFTLLSAGFLVGIGVWFEKTETPNVERPAVIAQQEQEGWEMVYGDHEGYNFTPPVEAIYTATDDASASEAVETWIDQVKTDPTVLARVSEVLLHKDGIDETTLYETASDGTMWANDKAQELVEQLTVWAETARSITAGTIESTGWNTGIDGTSMTTESGVTGDDRKGIIIIDADGNTVGILARCGNLVFPGQPSGIPEGPTDNGLQPKSPNKEDYQRPGTDDTTDSGVGEKPPVTVTEPVESAPQDPINEVIGNNGIVDSIISRPGSESGLTAPGATAPTTGITIPAPEIGANPNPTNGEENANSGDPGLPDGF